MYVKIYPSFKWKFLGKAIDFHHILFISKDLFDGKDTSGQSKDCTVIPWCFNIVFYFSSFCSAMLTYLFFLMRITSC